MIGTDLIKQQALDPDSKAMQRINFTENLDRPEKKTMFFIIEEAQKPFTFSTRNRETIGNLF